VVNAALCFLLCLVGVSGLFALLEAHLLAVLLVLVYAGAVVALFLFIIMLLDLKDEKRRSTSFAPLVAGLSLVGIFFIQLIGVLSHKLENQVAPALDKATLAAASGDYVVNGTPTKISQALERGQLPDVHLIGHTLFTQYNLPFQILGVLLLVSTVGVVVLSKRQTS